MRIYLTVLLLLISVSGVSARNTDGIDSLKTLLTSTQADKVQPDTVTVNRLNNIASQFFLLNPDSTLYYANKAVEIAQKINFKAGKANALAQIAHSYYFKGDFTQAKQDFNSAVETYKSINNYQGLSDCYLLIGRMYSVLAEYKTALVYLNKALAINLKLKNQPVIADCYKNIGIVHYTEGKLPAALDYYYQALLIDIKIHDKQAEAANYNDIGVVLESMEVYPRALEYYQKALKLFAAGNNNLQGVGTVYENIGEVFLAQHDYDRALIYSSKSLKIAKQQDDKDGLCSVFTDLGLYYAHKNQFDKAVKYLDTSLQIANKYNIVYNGAYAYIGFATVYNLHSDYKNAYKYAIKGQQLAVKLGNLGVRYDAALQLSKTLAGLGQFNEAYKMLNEYNALKDSLNNNESLQKLTSYTLELDFAAKQHQQQEREILYRQSIKQQELINTIFLIVITGMIITAVVYYRQKLKQQKINLMLAEKNEEVVQQKADLDDQANKLNELNNLKDRLISVLAHDLRAPLSTLRGLFGLLQDETISHEQMLNMIPGVLKNLEYTSDFLDTLLFWINSQMENFENSVKNFYVKDIIELEAASYYEQSAIKGITLIDNVPEDIIASADPSSVRIVIRNLITNAIKFSGENDTIEITCVQHDPLHLMITVSDTGIGISAELIGHLFKNKVDSITGTQNETGTGMGLLFCKDLIEKCNGKIWVNSEPGKGTSFSFTLPAGILNEQDMELV